MVKEFVKIDLQLTCVSIVVSFPLELPFVRFFVSPSALIVTLLNCFVIYVRLSVGCSD